jgi:hypothetical protein
VRRHPAHNKKLIVERCLEALNILSAGAAQAVVARLVDTLRLEHPGAVNACYGAVQSMKSRVLVGEAVDVIVLTDALLDELVRQKLVVPGSRAELGTVGTGLAVRAGTPVPEVASLKALRANLLAAEKIVCPDPAVATAGMVLIKVLERLEILEQVRPRLVYCNSGHEAMARTGARHRPARTRRHADDGNHRRRRHGAGRPVAGRAAKQGHLFRRPGRAFKKPRAGARLHAPPDR